MASARSSKRRVTGRWFKSSFSNGTALCVEVRFVGEAAVQIRDSKWRPTGTDAEDQPVVTVPVVAWQRFLDELKVGPAVDGPIVWRPDQHGGAELIANGVRLSFTHGEVQAFGRGVQAGEFDRITAA
ncbi:MAG: DUF397 domain-containing protein [Acidimicrobiales bacterium]